VPTSLVSLVDIDRQFFKSQLGLAEPWASRRQTPLSHSFCQHAVTSGEPFVVDDARADARVAGNPAIDELGVVAYAGVPLVVQGEPIGALCAIDGRPRRWTADELAVLADLAAAAMTEIELRLALRQLDETTSLVRSVLDTMAESVIVSDLDGNTVLFNRASERVLGRGSGRRGTTSPIIDHGMFEADGVTALPVERSPLARALAGESLREALVRIRPSGDESDDRWHSVNASPLHRADGSIRGAVVVGRDVTELTRARQRLEEISIRDELTGLYNRRGFLEHGRPLVAIATRKQRCLALIYVDLDGLKAINDGLGHEHGDHAIRDMGHVLAGMFRGSDVVARLGGDEFVVLAPECAGTAGDEPALRARITTALDRFNASGVRAYRLAASVGISAYLPGDGPRTLEELLAEGDARMYEHKKARKAAR
jgi:diguanylate cyclase (GGDEF)-like protein